MDISRHQAVIDQLWPPGANALPGVWAVLDLAHGPRIHAALLESRLEHLCLYAGQLPRELEMVAPHLVELPREHRLVDRLVDEGWGHSWGVFLKIDDPSNLRHHLRKFLKVQDQRGRSLLFRYYDPRVLRSFLPTCSAAELREYFGPVRSFVAEGEDGDSVVEFSLAAGALRCVARPLAVAIDQA